MAKFQCKYCGAAYSSVQALTMQKCPRHPSGAGKGYHVLYEGGEKSQYTCKYCGQKYSSINALTGQRCPRHPSGVSKGNHEPAL